MSETKKLVNITQKQISSKGVQGLANRPNKPSTYGMGGLSAEALKLWFDQLSTFLAGKINDIQDAISGNDAAAYIRVALDESGISNLDDLIDSMQNGTFAAEILRVLPSAAAAETELLQTVINDLARRLAEAEEATDDSSDRLERLEAAFAAATGTDVSNVVLKSELILPQIIVSVDAGATVKCVGPKETVTVTADNAGRAIFNIRGYATYIVHATLGGESSDFAAVKVDDVKQYEQTLTFFRSTVRVYADNNSVIVLSQDGTSEQKTVVNDYIDFIVHKSGNFTVTATLGNKTKTNTVTISESGETAITYIVYASNILGENSWSTIAEVSAAGNASKIWNVGDRKEISISGSIGEAFTAQNMVIYAVILGFDHNSEIEGSGISFGLFFGNGNLIALTDDRYGTSQSGDAEDMKKFSMNHHSNSSNYSNAGGWKACDLRYDILGSTKVKGADTTETAVTSPVEDSLMAALPAALRNVMKQMTKYTDNVGGSGECAANDVTSSVDYIALLSEYEVFGEITNGNDYEAEKQVQYEFFRCGNSREALKNLTATAARYFLRSPRRKNGYDNYFMAVDESGDSSSLVPGVSRGIFAVILV